MEGSRKMLIKEEIKQKKKKKAKKKRKETKRTWTRILKANDENKFTSTVSSQKWPPSKKSVSAWGATFFVQKILFS